MNAWPPITQWNIMSLLSEDYSNLLVDWYSDLERRSTCFQQTQRWYLPIKIEYLTCTYRSVIVPYTVYVNFFANYVGKNIKDKNSNKTMYSAISK